ncbi:anthranilate phosphoribosyltransferase [Acetivibrio saccincola]|jgi:anthranilate phosphoribosyltransferase|uniref:Anthranilate phosphoribosyltransferase n=1 Tax=Acetivibrio saccincola TaxID=1677857 RepID=A0A2K9E101_9FIRM|nr:anthranilate phosphoribosyltransferase [Acetivibrio saccincola]AUG57457.1 Anthranilate phosphoribosyltransferase [Acetivibrio saccincola]NLW27363.1 anthranilate phosphoribosyltransferase [Acetivibrio saccincola]PQQ67379.1 anthranilate phosphoribosyltransferase [Acetivibrio saccincola]HOA98012.1 anthranilate phosphoribosyltransferase [Acetivibrio saccincola]HQD29399.1 anthranilate phosphoribosyltransferase [Acetivibrio saccincola]
MLKEAIAKLVEGKNLNEEEAISSLDCIMSGKATDAQIGSFITALRIKGETIEEITGCAKVMREKAYRINPEVGYYIDTCGTGGDGSNTFNISTATAFVAAAGGVAVAKHGNRSVSSRSGSADVLESLGINIEIPPEMVKDCIEKVGIGFMFAPHFHKSMRYAAGPRKELGIRTIFNILGPLTNPANAKGQVLGVFDERLTEPVANVLLNLGVEKAMVIHGLDGMDEITTTTRTKVSEVRDGSIINYYIDPEEYGFSLAEKEELIGGDAKENADIIYSIFNGEKGKKRDIILLNSAAALYVGKVAKTIKEGIEMAAEIIDSKKAMEKVYELKNYLDLNYFNCKVALNG